MHACTTKRVEIETEVPYRIDDELIFRIGGESIWGKFKLHNAQTSDVVALTSHNEMIVTSTNHGGFMLIGATRNLSGTCTITDTKGLPLFVSDNCLKRTGKKHIDALARIEVGDILRHGNKGYQAKVVHVCSEGSLVLEREVQLDEIQPSQVVIYINYRDEALGNIFGVKWSATKPVDVK